MNNISENTLYKFVFNPDALSIDTKSYINDNIDRFADEIEFLKNLQANLAEEMPKTILDRIHEKIEEQETANEITLNLVEPPKGDSKCILAADSLNSEIKPITCSFIDKTNSYLGKVINKDNQNKIYIFTKNEREDLEFSITIFPSKDVYYINSDEMPLIVSPLQSIKKIQLKLN